MRGDDEVIALLNEQLTRELTAINQYFLHAKMQGNWGFTKLAEHTRHEHSRLFDRRAAETGEPPPPIQAGPLKKASSRHSQSC